jgi:DNA helicase HerA-like ATPase
MQSDGSTSYFARTTFRHKHTLFGIKQADRLSHVYVIGKTGVGKSTLLETLALQDLSAGRGFALIDPHGDLVERVYAAIPEEQRERVRYLNAPDPHQPFGYNPLRRVRDDISGIFSTAS